MALPAATIAEGVLGLEGIHTFRGLAMNDLTQQVPAVTYRYKVTKITGLHARADSEDNREARRGHMGEFTYPSLLRGRTIVYEGKIQAQDLVAMRIASNNLRSAFASPDPEGELTISPPGARGGVGFGTIVRPMAEEMDDVQEFGPNAMPSPFQRQFMVTVRAHDPRYYVVGPVTASAGAGANLAITNSGNAPSEPYFTLNGPITTDVTLHRDDVEPRSLILDKDVLTPITSGRHLIVDFNTRVIYCPELSGSDFSGSVKYASNWWDDQASGLVPGAQTIGVNGAAWTMNYRHASY